MKEWEIRVHRLLRQAGLSRTHRGYGYLVYSMELAREEPERLKLPTKGIYPAVARAFHTTPSGVDGGLRTAARLCRTRCPGLYRGGDGPEISVKSFLQAVYRAACLPDG